MNGKGASTGGNNLISDFFRLGFTAAIVDGN
jgi:hypothetical protein